MVQRFSFMAALFILPLTGFVADAAAPTETSWKLTSDRDYLPTLLGDLKDAKQAVAVTMYLIQMEDPERHTLIKGLLDELIACHKRGLKVSVVAELEKAKGDESPTRSMGALEYLKKGGVSVYTDDPDTVTHSKVVVIDEAIVHLGSSNWTYSAFMKNRECNLRIRNPELARQLLEALSRQDKKPL
ncbi:MAG: phospholipase D-like domain-containing protein [Planctomycetota bacterium]